MVFFNKNFSYQIKFTFDERDLKNGFKISGALKVTATD